MVWRGGLGLLRGRGGDLGAEDGFGVDIHSKKLQKRARENRPCVMRQRIPTPELRVQFPRGLPSLSLYDTAEKPKVKT